MSAYRTAAEEDAHCASVAAEVAAGFRKGSLPPFIGIRIKPLSSELHRRALRTLDQSVRVSAGTVGAASTARGRAGCTTSFRSLQPVRLP